MDTAPILDGPPAFILFGFIMALAAYIRSVALDAQKQLDEIELGISKLFLLTADAPRQTTEEKMKSLRTTRKRLAWVTHALFALMVLLAGRIYFYAASRMNLDFPFAISDAARYRWDVFVSVAVLALVATMWVMHTAARRKSDRIRQSLNVRPSGVTEK